MPKINLGDFARDTVTGFQGIVTARTEYLSAPPRVSLQPRVDSEGKFADPQHFDKAAIEVLEVAACTPQP